MHAKDIIEIFPEVTDKKLRDWAKEDLLSSPFRSGQGYGEGVINEWPDDTVERIKIILDCNNKRVIPDKTRVALIARGYFVGDERVKVAILYAIDKIDACFENDFLPDGFTLKKHEEISKLEDWQIDAIGSDKPSKNEPKNQKLNTAWLTSCLLFPSRIIKVLKNVEHPENSKPFENLEELPPLTRFLTMFNIYSIEQMLKELQPGELENAFYNSAPLYGWFLPIVGTLAGFNYGRVPDIEIYRGCLDNIKTKFKKIEFEALVRIIVMLFYIIIYRNAEEASYLMNGIIRYGITVDEDYLPTR